MKILFFGRKLDKYSINIFKFLKTYDKNCTAIWSDGKSNKLNKNLKKVDFIICFRSHYILNQIQLNKASIASINFHPGTPKYRGIGCINYAILKGEKIYGTTAHIMNKKIDSGKILNIKKFKISKKDNITSILKNTHKCMYFQCLNLIKKIFKNKSNINKLIAKNKNIHWSKKIMTRKKLDNFYKIDTSISRTKLKLINKALNYKNYKPYIEIHKKKFELRNDKQK